MIATNPSQSLSEFREHSSETIERINRTGEAEYLTVDGEARAVLLSPTNYDELLKEAMLARDLAAMQQSIRAFDAGHGQEVGEAFARMRAQRLKVREGVDRHEEGHIE